MPLLTIGYTESMMDSLIRSILNGQLEFLHLQHCLPSSIVFKKTNAPLFRVYRLQIYTRCRYHRHLVGPFALLYLLPSVFQSPIFSLGYTPLAFSESDTSGECLIKKVTRTPGRKFLPGVLFAQPTGGASTGSRMARASFAPCI